MSRSSWKVPFINKTSKFSKPSRFSTVTAYFLDKKLKIYNGIWFLSVLVKSNMLGHKFGEFSVTKKLGRDIHQKSKKKKSKKRSKKS